MNSSQNGTLFTLYASPRTVFSTAGISLLTGEAHGVGLAKKLNYYVREGKLLNPRRGVYAKAGYNPEEMACLLYTPSYLSLEYILGRAGIIFQYDSRLTAVSYLTRNIEVDGREITYRRIKGEILADTRGIESQGNIHRATAERAFLDTLYLNANYYFDNLRPLDRRRVLDLLPIYHNLRMEERVARLFGK